MGRTLFSSLAIAITILAPSAWSEPGRDGLNPPNTSDELFRVRIENAAGGRVQVSIDRGRSYATVGRVRRHAVATYIGFSAAAYVPPGTVSATAVHGIRLRTGTVGSGRQAKPVTVSILPLEFDETPKGFGGHISYGSGIYTDIPAGTGLFRNFAPFVGSSVRLESRGRLTDLRDGWKPSEGDVIVIVSSLHQPYLQEIEFENRAGGAVTARYRDGALERVATVVRPVKGVGRFDGTSYTGVGLVNTNHGGVLTISTAPISDSKAREGEGRERRGGFMIQPIEHAKTQYPMPQAMVVAPAKGGARLEGRAPLFSGFIGLTYDPLDTANSLVAQVSLRGGPWERMPEMIGKLDDVLSSTGVTGIRLLFPRLDREFLARALEAAKKLAMRGETVVRGIVTLRPERDPAPGCIVAFIIDGELRSATTSPPYEYLWNTESASNGDHVVAIRVSDPSGKEMWTETRRVVVDNPSRKAMCNCNAYRGYTASGFLPAAEVLSVVG